MGTTEQIITALNRTPCSKFPIDSKVTSGVDKTRLQSSNPDSSPNANFVRVFELSINSQAMITSGLT